MKHFFILFFILTVKFPNLQAQETKNTIEFTCILPIENPPKFPGGTDSLFAFIERNFQWSQDQATVEGKVFVQFIVNAEGTVSNVEVIRGLCENCDLEAIRLVKLMPKWKPGLLKGIAVKTRMVIPIKFCL